MADDSESDRPPRDADESEDRPSDDTETPESSDEREEASAPSDDPDSGGFDFGGPPDDGTIPPSDYVPDATVPGYSEDDDADDAGESAPDDDASDTADAADGSETEASDADDADDADADADDDPDTAATSENCPDAEADPDEVDDVTLEREDLIPPPGEGDETAPEPDEWDADAEADDADADASDGDTDATDDDPDADDETDDSDPEDLWPEGHEPPEAKTAKELKWSEEDGETEGAVADTDGGSPANANATIGGTDPEPADVDDGVFGDGPESDEEMPLADHIEEMVNRLAVVFLVGGVVTLLLYPGADLANSALNLNLVSSTEVINFLWNRHIPGAPEIADRRPRVYGPLELVLTELKVAGLAGLVVGLPAFVYETYLFMRPGLFPRERRYYLAAVPTSLVLAFIGIAFAHFIVLPAIFAYFTSYTQGTAVIAFGLRETFNLILILMGYNAIIFQIPLFIMLAIMMNLVTRIWLVERRLLFWASFLGLAFFVSPDPTGMAPIIIAATMITLFEGTLFLLRWTGRGSLAPTAEGLATYRPHAVVLAALVGYLLSPLPAPTGYYDRLPSVVTETLAANDLAVYTPVVIAGVLVGVFELASFILRRYGHSRRMLRARLAVSTARRPVWLVAIVVGYLGSPDPVLLRWATEPSLDPALAGGIAVGLVLGYEALRLLLASREDRGA